jgi:aminopeptidase N
VSPDAIVRDGFFESLSDPKNREHEPWVLQGLRYLHHPLRAERAERYIRPSLDLLHRRHLLPEGVARRNARRP